MHDYFLLHLIVHVHVFLAGYLFTISMIYIDPMPHRVPFLYRAIVLCVALTGHGILSKYIYAHPPNHVTINQAELGGAWSCIMEGGISSTLLLSSSSVYSGLEQPDLELD